MKQTIFIVIGLTAIIALGICTNRTKPAPETSVSSNGAPASSPAPLPGAGTRQTSGMAASAIKGAAVPDVQPPSRIAKTANSSPKLETEEAKVFRQAMETLVSPQSTFTQKRAAWRQLKATGKLDDAISELEARVASNPQSVDDTVALGEAYLKKCGQSDDIRVTATLAMKADQLLDNALAGDPSNWEAQYYKASAMAKWPLELGQGPKVMQEFQTLIQQQESQTPQPQFADTYVNLGDFYQRSGNAQSAMQVWQHGAALFPDNEELQGKLSGH